MKNQNIWYIPPKGNRLERTIIAAVNFVTDVVYEKIVKPNSEKLEINIADTDNLKQDTAEIYEQQLDTEYKLELAKDEIVDQMEQQIDLEFRISQLEDNMGG